MSKFLLWFVVPFVLLWLVGWVLNRLRPRIARKFHSVLQKTERHLPQGMLPIEHTLFGLALGGLMVVIATFPHWGPWGFIVRPATDATLQPGVLLGSAAALLALLIFAANQVQNLERDAGSGHLYLGQNINTFLARRSRIVKILALPIFHVAISALFILPLVWSSLPPSAEASTLGSGLLPGDWTLQLVTIAFWCASFGAVSGVLLLNVLGALHNSTLGFRAPTGLKMRIRFELGDRSDQTYTELFSGAHGFRHEMYQWIAGCVEEASKLPHEQQRIYLHETVGSFKYRIHQEKTIKKCSKILKKLEPSRDASTVGKRLAPWLLKYRVNRAENLLQKRSNLAYERTRAMLTSLPDTDLTHEARDWLIKQCIIEVSSYDQHATRFLDGEFFSIEKRNQTHQDRFYREARGILTRPAHKISELNGYARWYPRDQKSPCVEILPTFIIRTLAAILLPRNSKEDSKVSVEILQNIIGAADRLSHERTRDHALRHLVTAVIDCTIITRSDSETLPMNVLATRNRMSGDARHLEHSNRKSRELIIEEQTVTALTANTDLRPEAQAALLELLTGWLRPTVLLYLLFYRARTHRILSSSELQPFYQALNSYRWARLDTRAEALRSALRFFKKSNLNHFVTAEAVTWLFRALGKPLTLEMCVAFLKANIAELSLLQFIQWRVLASEELSYDGTSELEIERDIRRQLIVSKPEIQQFAKEWRTVNPITASELEMMLLRFPSE